MFKNFLTKNFYQKIIFLAIALSLIFIFLSPINAIDVNSSDDLNKTVTDAVDGSVINLKNGTYTTGVINITVDKEITIASKNPQETIIDLEKKGIIFTITTNGILTLENITILNGNSTSRGTIINSGELILKNCNISNNNVAIYNGDGKISIINCYFMNNTGNTFGGAIYIGRNATGIDIEGSTFLNNYAGTYGGAIALIGGDLNQIMLCNATIKNSTFKNNGAGFDGGAIYNRHYNITIGDCGFDNNYVINNSGGAFTTGSAANTTVIRCNFMNNKAFYAGAIFNTGFLINIIDSNFTNNSATGYYGGGAICSRISRLNVTGCIFNNNNGNGTFGGAVSNIAGLANITKCVFNNNIASAGGAISNMYDGYYPQMDVRDSVFINNTDSQGIAVRMLGIYNNIIGSNFTGNPLALFINATYTNISGCNISNNDNGISIVGSSSNISVNGCVILNNDNGISISDSSNNISIIGCNIMNNLKGISVIDSATNITINYNRIFNNSHYDFSTSGNINLDKNWWGNNSLPADVDKSKTGDNYIIDNHFITILNTTARNPIVYGSSITYSYYLVLNTTLKEDNNDKLPYFSTTMNNFDGSTELIDARDEKSFDFIVNLLKDVSVSSTTDNKLNILNFEIVKVSSKFYVSSPSNATLGNDVLLEVTLFGDGGNPVINSTVDFYVNGVKVGSGITNADGYAYFNYKPSKAGNYNWYAQFTSRTGDIYNDTTSDLKSFQVLSNSKNESNTNPVNNNNNNNSNNKGDNGKIFNPLSTKGAMKETGMPIIAIFLVLLSSLGIIRKKL